MLHAYTPSVGSVPVGDSGCCLLINLILQALDLIRGKNILTFMDSSLEGQYSTEDATKLVDLASTCLQSEARDRPNTKFLLAAVTPLQKQSEVTIDNTQLFNPANFYYIVSL